MYLEIIKSNNQLYLTFGDFDDEPFFYQSLSKFERFDQRETITIKKVFTVDNTLSKAKIKMDQTSESRSCVIGTLNGEYYELDKKVFQTKQSFFFHESIDIRIECFLVNPNISLLKYIDSIVDCDIYIGGMDDDSSKQIIPEKDYEELLKKFPNSTEIKKYREKRVKEQISEFVTIKTKKEDDFQNYLDKKLSVRESKSLMDLQNIDSQKFQFILAILKEMIEDFERYKEKVWQKEILKIIQFIYPKYVHASENIHLKTSQGSNKYIDLCLLDFDGNVDIIEIKRPKEYQILNKTKYRDNYFPSKELSGTIMQLESYLYHLNKADRNSIQKIQKKKFSHFNGQINIRNAKGMIIIGRSNNFSEEQKHDFELIKRKYLHVMDILSYDDLIQRLENLTCKITGDF